MGESYFMMMLIFVEDKQMARYLSFYFTSAHVMEHTWVNFKEILLKLDYLKKQKIYAFYGLHMLIIIHLNIQKNYQVLDNIF